jgi:hypothetical protein
LGPWRSVFAILKGANDPGHKLSARDRANGEQANLDLKDSRTLILFAQSRKPFPATSARASTDARACCSPSAVIMIRA